MDETYDGYLKLETHSTRLGIIIKRLQESSLKMNSILSSCFAYVQESYDQNQLTDVINNHNELLNDFRESYELLVDDIVTVREDVIRMLIESHEMLDQVEKIVKDELGNYS